MSGRHVSLNDKVAFAYAIDRVEPKVFKELYAMGSSATRKQVDVWLAKWHLDAAQTVFEPGLMLVEARSMLHGPVPSLSFDNPTHDLSLVILPWQPGDREEYRADFEKRAKAAIKAYADKVEAWAEKNGIATRSQKRALRMVRDRSDIARWEPLARRLVLRQTYLEIAGVIGSAKGITPQAVEKQTHKLAERLGISLA